MIRFAVPSVTDPALAPVWKAAAPGIPRKASRIGYARVSTRDQNIGLQVRALEVYGCDTVHSERKSGASLNRQALRSAIRDCQPGDELVVWRLDRLGRDIRQLLDLDAALAHRQINLKVLTGQLGSFAEHCAERHMIFAIMAAISAYERNITSERTRAGLEFLRTPNLCLSGDFRACGQA